MINNKDDLYNYLAADKKALGRTGKRPRIGDFIWRYEILLRKCEFYENRIQNCRLSILPLRYYSLIKSFLGLLLGYTIPNNVCGKGLCISHIGTIVISDNASLGDYCRIHVGVNIGSDARIDKAAPTVGNYCYIGPGVKMFGAIRIGDNVAIGANSVVNKSFPSDCTIAGIPAKIINNKGSRDIIRINSCEE